MKTRGVAIIDYDISSFTEGAHEETILKLALDNLVSGSSNVLGYQLLIDPYSIKSATKGT